MLTEANDFMFSVLQGSGSDVFESVYNADGGYVWNNKDVAYPSVCFEILSIQTTESTNVYNYRVTAANRQTEGIEGTTQENYNLLFTALETAFNEYEQPTAYNESLFSISQSRNYQFAPLKLMDVCAVCSVDISVTEYVGEC